MQYLPTQKTRQQGKHDAEGPRAHKDKMIGIEAAATTTTKHSHSHSERNAYVENNQQAQPPAPTTAYD